MDDRRKAPHYANVETLGRIGTFVRCDSLRDARDMLYDYLAMGDDVPIVRRFVTDEHHNHVEDVDRNG